MGKVAAWSYVPEGYIVHEAAPKCGISERYHLRVDGFFGVHWDSKGHTGDMVSMGKVVEEHRSLGGSIISRLDNGAFVGLIYKLLVFS